MQIELSTIPVYYKSEAAFRKECEKIFEPCSKQISDMLRLSYYPRTVWRFNQIVGYIVISVDTEGKEITFKVYKSLKKYYSFGSKRRYLEDMHCPNLRIRYMGQNKEKTIADIFDMIQEIKKSLFKKRYIELDGINSVIELIKRIDTEEFL